MTTELHPALPRELLDSPSFLLKRIGFAAKSRAMEAFERVGLSPYQYAVLAVLDDEPRETQAEIADMLGYDRSQLVGLLDELEEQELIERKRDPTDRRRHLVKLTADGRRTLGKLRRLSAQLEADFLEPLDDGERAELLALLRKLAERHEPRCAPPRP